MLMIHFEEISFYLLLLVFVYLLSSLLCPLCVILLSIYTQSQHLLSAFRDTFGFGCWDLEMLRNSVY